MLRPVPSVGSAGDAKSRRLADRSGIVATRVVHLTGATRGVPRCAVVLGSLHSTHLHPVSRVVPTATAMSSLASCRPEHSGRDDDQNEDHGDHHRYANPKRDGSAQRRSATLPFPLALR
jgi:hypothetical protein